MTLDRFAAQIQSLADLEEIRGLKARYLALVDACVNQMRPELVEPLAELLTDDVVIQLAANFIVQGNTELKTRLGEVLIGRNLSTCHIAFSPVIEIDGAVARGSWMMLIEAQPRNGPRRLRPVTGFYEDEFVRTPDGWKQRRRKFTPAVH